MKDIDVEQAALSLLLAAGSVKGYDLFNMLVLGIRDPSHADARMHRIGVALARLEDSQHVRVRSAKNGDRTWSLPDVAARRWARDCLQCRTTLNLQEH